MVDFRNLWKGIVSLHESDKYHLFPLRRKEQTFSLSQSSVSAASKPSCRREHVWVDLYYVRIDYIKVEYDATAHPLPIEFYDTICLWLEGSLV